MEERKLVHTCKVLDKGQLVVKIHVECAKTLERLEHEEYVCAHWDEPGCKFDLGIDKRNWEELVTQVVTQPVQMALAAKALQYQVKELTTEIATLKKQGVHN